MKKETKLYTVYRICRYEDLEDLTQGFTGLTVKNIQSRFELYKEQARQGKLQHKPLADLLTSYSDVGIWSLAKFYDEQRARDYLTYVKLQAAEEATEELL